MATYVAIRKLSGNESHVEYKFGPNEETVGRLRIDRRTGTIEILEEVPGDDSRSYSIRASRKLTLHFRNNEFPETTCFAS